jgi:hypothetical protein
MDPNSGTDRAGEGDRLMLRPILGNCLEQQFEMVAYPATRQHALKTRCFRGLFAARILAGNFVRGSVAEAAEGKSQHKIDGLACDLMTQL